MTFEPPPERDFYDLLGLDPSASDSELSVAFRDASQRLRFRKANAIAPGDRQQAERDEQSLMAARRVLMDPARRMAYDQEREGMSLPGLSPGLPGMATRPCPFCAEDLPLQAERCSFCGEVLAASSEVAPMAAAPEIEPLPPPSSLSEVLSTEEPPVEAPPASQAIERPAPMPATVPVPPRPVWPWVAIALVVLALAGAFLGSLRHSQPDLASVETTVRKWQEAKQISMRQVDPSLLETCLTGKALEEARSSVAWLRENGMYWDRRLISANFESPERLADASVRTRVLIHEAGERIVAATGRVDHAEDTTYLVEYQLIWANDHWLISDKRVLK